MTDGGYATTLAIVPATYTFMERSTFPGYDAHLWQIACIVMLSEAKHLQNRAGHVVEILRFAQDDAPANQEDSGTLLRQTPFPRRFWTFA